MVHLGVFVVLSIYIQQSIDPQVPLQRGVFAAVDFPLGLIYSGSGAISRSVGQVESAWLGQYLYLPYLIHGLLGTIRWYILHKLLATGRIGSVW